MTSLMIWLSPTVAGFVGVWVGYRLGAGRRPKPLYYPPMSTTPPTDLSEPRWMATGEDGAVSSTEQGE